MQALTVMLRYSPILVQVETISERGGKLSWLVGRLFWAVLGDWQEDRVRSDGFNVGLIATLPPNTCVDLLSLHRVTNAARMYQPDHCYQMKVRPRRSLRLQTSAAHKLVLVPSMPLPHATVKPTECHGHGQLQSTASLKPSPTDAPVNCVCIACRGSANDDQLPFASVIGEPILNGMPIIIWSMAFAGQAGRVHSGRAGGTTNPDGSPYA